MRSKKEKTLSYVSTILLIGSFCAAGLLLVGLCTSVVQPQTHDAFTGPDGFSFSGLAQALLRGEPLAVMNLGILVMMFTPFLRVVAASFSFLLEKDPLYAAVGFGVMLILLLTIVPSLL
jgi:uncharacterized membrane protein